MVDETFDNNQTLLTWKWGEMSERYLLNGVIYLHMGGNIVMVQIL